MFLKKEKMSLFILRPSMLKRKYIILQLFVQYCHKCKKKVKPLEKALRKENVTNSELCAYSF